MNPLQPRPHTPKNSPPPRIPLLFLVLCALISQTIGAQEWRGAINPSGATPTEIKLDPGFEIRGQVRDDGGVPLPFTAVQLRDVDGIHLGFAFGDDEGRYAFTQLGPGTYLVNSASLTHINEVWPDIPCSFSNNCPTLGATPIVLQTGQMVSDIDFEIALGGVLRASIRDELSGTLLEGLIRLFDTAGTFLMGKKTESPEEIEITGLASGEYRALGAANGGAFLAQVYEGSDCPGASPDSCEAIVAGTPIEIVQGQETQIEFALEKTPPICQSDPQTLCLNGGRFAVRTSWRTPTGAQGPGIAVPLADIDDSGVFWFFNAENAELVIKVLDACGEPYDRFWVFAAGLTDVAVDISITDIFTGEERTYSNPIGTAFQPIQDTDAFDTCIDAGVGPPDISEPSIPPNAILATLSAQLEAARQRGDDWRSRAPSPTEKFTCQPSPSALCLGVVGRFRVEATWEMPDGNSGSATAIPFRRDTGMLWFFDSSNVEMVVKVLDACAAPFERFWVFASGLTNVSVRLKVTDTVTGDVRIYDNAQGEPFRPIQDTVAFDTCP